MRPSVCGRDYRWTYWMDFFISFKFQMLVVLGIPPDFFISQKAFSDIFTNYFSFHHHGTLWQQRFQNATLPTNHSQMFSNFSWIFFSMVLTKLLWDFWKFEIWNFNISCSFSLTWNPTRKMKILKRYSCKSQQKVFKLVLNSTPP